MAEPRIPCPVTYTSWAPVAGPGAADLTYSAVVGAENLCHLAGCPEGRGLFSPAGTAGRGMIFGLWG